MAALGATTVGIFAAGLWLAVATRQAWPAFYSAIAEAGAVLGLAIPWALRHLNTIDKGLGQFESIRKQIDRKLEEERTRQRSSVAEAETSYAEAAASVAAAAARFSAAQQRAAEAEREMEQSRSVNRIARLLEDRLANKSYERYLGIIAAIRGDFEKLSKLMKTMREEGRGGNGALQPIDRIVLYIDDLDRCPGEQVVRVLEAIHLLLAFELFVVVVGVDIRWAARSLAEKYPSHLSAGVFEGHNRNPAVGVAGDGVSALDYLEKIFQIPFWLPPMEEDASRNMIAEMVPRPLESNPQPEGQAQPHEQGSSNVERQVSSVVAETATAGSAPLADSNKPELLAMEGEERNFMLGLAGAVGKSPRRLKRFVNTYRLLKASLDGLQRETFVVQGGRQGEYRSAMALLALATGAPRSSLELLESLAGFSAESTLDVFEKLVQEVADPAERQYATAALVRYRKATAEAAPTVKELQTWAPQVARFSFRSART